MPSYQGSLPRGAAHVARICRPVPHPDTAPATCVDSPWGSDANTMLWSSSARDDDHSTLFASERDGSQLPRRCACSPYLSARPAPRHRARYGSLTLLAFARTGCYGRRLYYGWMKEASGGWGHPLKYHNHLGSPRVESCFGRSDRGLHTHTRRALLTFLTPALLMRS